MWSYTEVERCEIKLLWNWGRSVKKCNYTDDFHWAVMWSGSISFYITNTLQPAKLSAAFNKSFDSSFIRWLSVDLVRQIHTCQSDSDTRGCGPALSEPPKSFDKNSDLRPPPVLGVAGWTLPRMVCVWVSTQFCCASVQNAFLWRMKKRRRWYEREAALNLYVPGAKTGAGNEIMSFIKGRMNPVSVPQLPCYHL